MYNLLMVLLCMSVRVLTHLIKMIGLDWKTCLLKLYARDSTNSCNTVCKWQQIAGKFTENDHAGFAKFAWLKLRNNSSLTFEKHIVKLSYCCRCNDNITVIITWPAPLSPVTKTSLLNKNGNWSKPSLRKQINDQQCRYTRHDYTVSQKKHTNFETV